LRQAPAIQQPRFQTDHSQVDQVSGRGLAPITQSCIPMELRHRTGGNLTALARVEPCRRRRRRPGRLPSTC
jgi:hypothetical protein